MTVQAATERKQRLRQEIDRYIALLTERRDPEKIILFGSLAKDTVHEWSDIDLVIIEETDRPFWDRLREIRTLLKPTVGIDILVYTPAEFEEMQRDRAFVRESIVGKGVVLYERGQ